MNGYVTTLFRALIIGAACTAPGLAIENPVVVDVRGAGAAPSSASATIFEHGSEVLVSLTGHRGIPDNVAVTLNDGSCTSPGGVAFALSPIKDEQSMTQLRHSLSDVAGKAKSMVVHKTSSETSPALACGELKS